VAPGVGQVEAKAADLAAEGYLHRVVNGIGLGLERSDGAKAAVGAIGVGTGTARNGKLDGCGTGRGHAVDGAVVAVGLCHGLTRRVGVLG
jgi:hypothetical protein